MCQDAWGVGLEFAVPFEGTFQVKNIYLQESDLPKAQKVFEQYARDGVVELRSC